LTIDVRQLAEADASEYHELRLRGLREHPDAFTSSYEEECERPLSWVKTRVANSVVLGAYVGGRLVGVLGMSVDPRAKVRHKAQVFGMYVAPEHAGRGIGKTLVGECIARARSMAGFEQLQLTVTDSNARAKALYERAGFRSFGVEPNAVKVAGRYYDKCYMMLVTSEAAAHSPEEAARRC
jgi:RimJ/RimL family protein N-acetyltransferase